MTLEPLASPAMTLLERLSDGQAHSGSQLADSLKVSRTTVWKQINSLKKAGYVIESLAGKGYQLISPTIPLLPSVIRQGAALIWPVSDVDVSVMPELPSTNDYVKQQHHQQHTAHLCTVEKQTQGRGRFNRHWHSPFGENIYLSYQTAVAVTLTEMSGFSLAISVAVIDAFKQVGIDTSEIAIKWPNDVLLNGKKLAGILIELAGEVGGNSNTIIGLGLNVNMGDADIDKPWTSLQQAFNKVYNRNALIIQLVKSIQSSIEKFEKSGLQSVLTQWRKYDALYDKTVRLDVMDQQLEGTCHGIDERGNILIAQANGQITSHSAGELSLHSSGY